MQPMFLDVGNLERIDDPTDDQISDRLRNLPIKTPFAILNINDEHFIQTTPFAGGYRVELRQGASMRFAVMTLGQAELLFKAFRRRDEPVLEDIEWKRLSVWNDPIRRSLMVAVAIVALAAISFWSSLR